MDPKSVRIGTFTFLSVSDFSFSRIFRIDVARSNGRNFPLIFSIIAKTCQIDFENFVPKARWSNLGNSFKKRPDNKTVLFFRASSWKNTIFHNIHQRGGKIHPCLNRKRLFCAQSPLVKIRSFLPETHILTFLPSSIMEACLPLA